MSRALVLVLTECAIADAHMSPTCSITVFQMLVDAMASGTLDSGTTYSSIIYLNRLAGKWFSRCRWLESGPTLDQGATETFSHIVSNGDAVYRSCLTVLRGMTDLLVQYSTSTVCKELCEWVTCPGYMTVLEMLHRGPHGPHSPSELVASVWTIAQSLLCVMKSIINSEASPAPPFTAILKACVSIAGTQNKLVNRTGAVIGGWSDVNFLRLKETCKVLCDTVHILVRMHAVATAHREANRNGGTNSSPENLNTVMRLALLLHMSIMGVMKTLRGRGLSCLEYRFCLQYCAASSIASIERPRVKRRMLRVCHGRILPGCCNPACMELAGVSEVELNTLLCSGCRRLPYCSRKCQKAHFIAGHGAQCGHGWWGLTGTDNDNDAEVAD